MTEEFSDEAKRVSDAVNLHVVVNGEDCIGQWVAFNMGDGTSDGNLYPSKDDAIRHQSNPEYFAFLCIVPGGMPVQEAETWLRYWRKMSGITREISTNPSLNLYVPHSREDL